MAQAGKIQLQGVPYIFRLEYPERKPGPAFPKVSGKAVKDQELVRNLITEQLDANCAGLNKEEML